MDDFRQAVKVLLKEDISMTNHFKVGDIVKIKNDAKRYYPGGPLIPNWVKSNHY